MASTPKLYTTIDSINYHLSNVFALYPTLYAVHDNLNLYLQVIAPLIRNSKEFCEYIKRKKMGISSKVAEGGFSMAGQFKVGDKIPMASGISFGPDGSWLSYFMETFSKTSHTSVPISIRAVTGQAGNPDIIISSDPIQEGIVGALASHLFDIGVAPSFMKYLGLYVCDDQYKIQNAVLAKPYFIFERSDVELYAFLGGEPETERKYEKIFSQTTPYDYMIWLVQMAHTHFVGKYYFGITNIDSFTKNIMLSYVKNTGSAIKWEGRSVTPLTYGKVELSKAQYYTYDMPFKVDSRGNIVDNTDPSGMPAKIMVENNGFLLKLIDLGSTIANFKESVVARANNIAFINEPHIYNRFVHGYEAATQNTHGDIDYNFATLNIAYRLARAIGIPTVGYRSPNGAPIDHYKTIWAGLYPFMKATLPPQFDPGNIKSGGPYIPAHTLDGKDQGRNLFSEFYNEPNSPGGYTMRHRAVGTTDNMQAPLIRIWNYLKDVNMSDGSPRRVIIQEAGLNSEPKVPDMRSERSYNLQLTRNNKPFPDASLFTKLKVVVPYFSNPKFNNLQKFIRYNFALWRGCVPKGRVLSQQEIDTIARDIDPSLVGRNSVDFCNIVDAELGKYDPNNKLPFPFFKNLVVKGKTVDGRIINNNKTIWDSATNSLKLGITKKLLTDSGFQRSKTNSVQLFSLRFNPSQTGIAKLGVENFIFHPDQRLTNYQPPANVGDTMKMVNVHLVYITPPVDIKSGFGIAVESNRDLYRSAQERLDKVTSGVSVNGGYFIVQPNYTDPLNYWVAPDLQGYPIGYFYSETTPKYNGTHLPVPRLYQQSFATIYVTPDNKIHMMRSIDFMNKHETENDIVLYSLSERKPPVNYAVQRQQIKMKKSDTGFLMPITNASNKNFLYKAAFECGPILIWDGKISFTRHKMETSMFRVDLGFGGDTPADKLPDGSPNPQARHLELYKVVTTAANSKMYFNEPGESNFPYGQRHSNSLMILNVMCETNDGDTLFVFVEGRGFDAVGLDRAQLAELISKFNVKHAVSMDGGFSANAVFKNPNSDETGYYWLLNDPDKRGLSSVIHFADIDV